MQQVEKRACQTTLKMLLEKSLKKMTDAVKWFFSSNSQNVTRELIAHNSYLVLLEYLYQTKIILKWYQFYSK